MKKYVVTKKCYANEFVFVEAENEVEAIQKAQDNDCASMSASLEWNGYLTKDKWITEELTPEYCGSPSSIRSRANQNKPHDAAGEVIYDDE